MNYSENGKQRHNLQEALMMMVDYRLETFYTASERPNSRIVETS